MYYEIRFFGEDGASIAADVIMGLRGEYDFEEVDSDGWFRSARGIGAVKIKCEGAYLYVKPDDPQKLNGTKILIDMITHAYAKYDPKVIRHDDNMGESYKPTSRRDAFNAMRQHKLRHYKVNEAFTILKKAGATIITEDKNINEAHPLYDKRAQESHKEQLIQKDTPKLDAALKIIQRLYPEATLSLGNMVIVKTPLGSYRRYPLENVNGRLIEIWCSLFEHRGELYNYKVIEWRQPNKTSYLEIGYGDNMLKKWVHRQIPHKAEV